MRLGHTLPQDAVDRARALRANATDAERKLWGKLRGSQLGGIKFRRQLPIGPYIVDFASTAARLVVEVDGSQHADNASYDERRTAFLNAQGYRVLRFWNVDVMQNVDGCLETIGHACAASPHPNPSPLKGEGLSGGRAAALDSPLPAASRLSLSPAGRGTKTAAAFARAAAEGRAALVMFVTAGDPSPEVTPLILDALVAGGADVIELGMAFSDPMADGPAIQAANLRALGAGVTLKRTLEIARDFLARHRDTPLILMGYMNPVLAYGPERFAADAAAAGVDGALIVDLPPEEADELAPALTRNSLHLIRLATPTTDDARLPPVLEGASGYLYYVSVAGITGANAAAADHIAAACRRLKARTDLPVAVGFGIRTPEQAAAAAQHADGVVVGSAIVETIARAHAARANDLPEQVRAQVAALRAAMVRT